MVDTPTLWSDLGRINTNDSGPGGNSQTDIKFTGLTGGGFVAVWGDRSQTGTDTSTGSIKGQRYDALGQEVGAEFTVDVGTTIYYEYFPEVAALPNGGFVVAFQRYIEGDFDIRTMEYDADGSEVGTAHFITSFIGEDEIHPSIAVFDDGSYLVAYQTNDNNISGKIVSTIGIVGSEIIIATNPNDDTQPSVTHLNNNTMVIAYETDFSPTDQDIRYTFVDAAGTITKASDYLVSSNVDELLVEVAALSGGGWVGVFKTEPGGETGDNDSGSIVAKVFDNAGAVISTQDVNTTTTGDQDQPSVTGLADGGFVVSWTNVDTGEIFAQRFNATGTMVGTEFVLSTDLTDIRAVPDLALLSDGRFVVGVLTQDLSPINLDVLGSIWDPRSAFIEGNAGNNVITSRQDGAQVNGLGGNDTLLGGAGVDLLFGGAGTDIVRGGGGNDQIFLQNTDGSFAGEIIDGGMGTDRLSFSSNASTTYSLGSTTILSIEELYFTADGVNIDKFVVLNASQFGGSGISNSVLINGDDEFGADETVGVFLEAVTNFSLAGWTFQNWGNQLESIQIVGDGDAESITGSSQHDLIFGVGGNDTLRGGSGDDTIDGGDDTDTAVFSGVSDNFSFVGNSDGTFTVIDNVGTEGTDTLVDIELVQFDDRTLNVIDGTVASETLQGTSGDDLIFGLSGNDYLLDLGGGDDILVGGDDDDQLQGSAGADRNIGGGGIDEVRYNNSNESVVVALSIGTATGGHAAGDTFDSIENLVGSQFADVLIGDSGANRLDGFAGDDLMQGGLGADVLYGGAGFDTSDYTNSTSKVNVGIYRIGTGGSSQGDQLILMEAIFGSIFNDTLVGGGLPLVTLNGGDGDDLLFDYGGASNLYGGDDNDILIGSLGADHHDGGDGIDVARFASAVGAVTINLQLGTGTGFDAEGDTFVNVENVVGSIFFDTLIGDGENNQLEGLAGRDRITGGGGDDQLYGGADLDTFVFDTTNWGNDTIYDFDPTREFLDVSAIGLTFADFVVFDTAFGIRLNYTDATFGVQTIALGGVDVGDISAADFIV